MSGVSATKPAAEPGGEARPRRVPRRGETAEFLQVLDRLRDTLLQKIERIEAIAAEQAALLDQDSTDRERALRERVALLEATQSRLQAEAKRRDQELQATFQQIENDRQLLAEAWERVERERVEVSSAKVTHYATPAAPPTHAGVTETNHPEPPRPRPGGDLDDPVTRSILWQFQALKSDVRRNAKRREGR